MRVGARAGHALDQAARVAAGKWPDHAGRRAAHRGGLRRAQAVEAPLRFVASSLATQVSEISDGFWRVIAQGRPWASDRATSHAQLLNATTAPTLRMRRTRSRRSFSAAVAAARSCSSALLIRAGRTQSSSAYTTASWRASGSAAPPGGAWLSRCRSGLKCVRPGTPVCLWGGVAGCSLERSALQHRIARRGPAQRSAAQRRSVAPASAPLRCFR